MTLISRLQSAQNRQTVVIELGVPEKSNLDTKIMKLAYLCELRYRLCNLGGTPSPKGLQNINVLSWQLRMTPRPTGPQGSLMPNLALLSAM